MSLKLTRKGNNYDVTALLTGGPGGNFNNSWTVTTRTPAAGDLSRFDAVSILLGGGLNADRAGFSNLDVTGFSTSRPDAAALIDALMVVVELPSRNGSSATTVSQGNGGNANG